MHVYVCVCMCTFPQLPPATQQRRVHLYDFPGNRRLLSRMQDTLSQAAVLVVVVDSSTVEQGETLSQLATCVVPVSSWGHVVSMPLLRTLWAPRLYFLSPAVAVLRCILLFSQDDAFSCCLGLLFLGPSPLCSLFSVSLS